MDDDGEKWVIQTMQPFPKTSKMIKHEKSGKTTFFIA